MTMTMAVVGPFRGPGKPKPSGGTRRRLLELEGRRFLMIALMLERKRGRKREEERKR